MRTKTKQIYLYWFSIYKKELENKTIDKWIKKIQSEYSISTQKVILASMKRYSSLEFKLNHSNNKTVHNIRTISEEQYQTLQNEITEAKFIDSIRTRKIIQILWETGMRISELLNLKWKDIGEKYIKIYGKGGKIRNIPYKRTLFESIKRNNEYVISTNKGKMKYSHAYKIFVKAKKLISDQTFSPHTLRHSFASRMIEKNVPIEFLSKILGHSSINTTMIYIHYNEGFISDFLNKI